MTVRIDGFLIDAAMTESHELEAEPTSFPTEDGSDFTDNVRKKPKRCTIEGVITDTPMGLAATERQRDNVLPSEAGLAKLEEIYENAEPITIETTLKVYDRMVLTSLVIPKDKDTGKSLRFTATFQELRIASTTRAVVRTSTPRARRKRDRGTQVATVSQMPITEYFDKNHNLRRAQFDPQRGENGHMIDPDTGQDMTQEEIDKWVADNEANPDYADSAFLPKEAGPGAYPGAPGSESPGGQTVPDEGYWPETTSPTSLEDARTLQRLRQADQHNQLFGNGGG